MKRIQIKIVMIFMILGIIIISALGIFSLYNLEIAFNSLSIEDIETKNLIIYQINKIEIAVYIALGAFVICTIVFRIYRY